MTDFERKLIDRLKAAGEAGMKAPEIARETMNWQYTLGVLDALVADGRLVKRVYAGNVEYACTNPHHC